MKNKTEGFRFRNFRVYTEIRKFIKDIYQLSVEFPTEEKFGLSDQIRRAATSVALNFAEGSGRQTDVDFNKFVVIAIGSIYEVVSVLDIALDLEYISKQEHKLYLEKSKAIVKQLFGLSRTLKKSKH